MTDRELLEEAKRRYPIGTVFKCLHGCSNGPIVKNDYSINETGNVIRVIDDTGCIYSYGEWAEIISNPEVKLSKNKPFHVVVTEENKKILSEWRFNNKSSKLNTGEITGLSLWHGERLQKGHNTAGMVKSDVYDFGNEITFKQFLELYPEYKENKPQFEVGKWYKYSGWYIKYKETEKSSVYKNGIFKSSCSIDTSKHYSSQEKQFGEACLKQKILLTDLSEIQQYLPDGHPDKFINHEFKVGDWFTPLENNIEHSGCETGGLYQIVEINSIGNIYFMISGYRMCISKKYHHLLKKGRSIYSETTSLVEAMKPLQDAYNLASYKIQQALINNLKTNNNEKTTRNTTSVKVQRPNIKIGTANPVRGNGLNCSRSKIQLGSNNSYNQKRFSSCKSRVS